MPPGNKPKLDVLHRAFSPLHKTFGSHNNEPAPNKYESSEIRYTESLQLTDNPVHELRTSHPPSRCSLAMRWCASSRQCMVAIPPSKVTTWRMSGRFALDSAKHFAAMFAKSRICSTPKSPSSLGSTIAARLPFSI